MPDAEALDFRGVKAFGAEAFLLAAGPGEQSRIYRTRNFGKQWDLQFTNHEPKGFLDCMAFFDEKHGIVMGDPVNGKFQVLRTDDGGNSWRYSVPGKMPPAIEGEGAFAASNTCLTTQGKKNAWFVTGGVVARVFRSTDRGKSWQVSETPIIHGEAAAGIFSVAFRDSQHGVIAGGDYQHPERGGANLAITDDGGKTWKLAPVAQQGYSSAIAYVSGGGVVAVGAAKSTFSKDGLRTWEFFSPTGFNALAVVPGTDIVYSAGAKGSISRGKLGP